MPLWMIKRGQITCSVYVQLDININILLYEFASGSVFILSLQIWNRKPILKLDVIKLFDVRLIIIDLHFYKGRWFHIKAIIHKSY